MSDTSNNFSTLKKICMKTSDKLLLGTALAAMLLFGGASLAVYARYKSGDIITEKEVFRLNHLKTALPAPSFLRIKGISDVHFIPADTFAIEYEKGGIREDGIIRPVNKNHVIIKEGNDLVLEPRYSRSGDTLIIDGYDPDALPSAPGSRAVNGVYSLTVYGLKSGSIELENGNSYIEGAAVAGSGDYRILLKQNRLQIGQKKEDETTENENPSYIRGLAVSASDGSSIELGRAVHIDDLRVELDSLCSLSEGTGWNIGKVHIQADGHAQFNISGSLWNKIMADAKADESPVSGQGKGRQ
jgi:hypothetical protein